MFNKPYWERTFLTFCNCCINGLFFHSQRLRKKTKRQLLPFIKSAVLVGKVCSMWSGLNAWTPRHTHTHLPLYKHAIIVTVQSYHHVELPAEVEPGLKTWTVWKH